MAEFEIIRGTTENLDLIKPHWEKLNELHKDLSPYFEERFDNMCWDKRKKTLIEKSSQLMFDYVVERKTGNIIGYCISSIERDNIKMGEVDSLYIDKKYRKSGIGKKLMDNAINWLIEQETETQRLLVAHENEDVLSYYKQFEFYPLHLILQRKK